MAGKRNQRSLKLVDLPERYTVDFVARMEGRRRAPRIFKARLAALVTDLGGAENLSYQQLDLARRAAFLGARLDATEEAAIGGKDIDLGVYTQMSNALLGLYRAVGLKRHAREVRLGDVLGGEA